MMRRSLFNTLSNQERSLSEVWQWYEFQCALVDEEKRRVLGALARGESPADRYYGKTRKELDDDFAFQTAELNLLSMFSMLACTEAALRVDFVVRVRNRKKDEVSRSFHAAHRELGDRIRLEEDILDVWREYGDVGIKGAVSKFKGTLTLRHWLAHGRWWKAKLGHAAGYNPLGVFDICRDLLQVIGLAP
jgi:hypothetical protein